MRDLLAEDGSIYVHMGPNVSHIIRSVLDEVFGRESFKNEIVWKRADSYNDPNKYGIINDSILFYTKSRNWAWNTEKENIPLSESTATNWYNNEEIAETDTVNRLGVLIKKGTKRYYNKADITGAGTNKNDKPFKGQMPPPGRHWEYRPEIMEDMDRQGRIVYSKSGKPYEKRYLDESRGSPPQSIWTDIQMLRGMTKHHEKSEWFGYSTQKPERLIERIINISSNEGDLVADFFCGSGTSAAVAEKLGCKWIVTDLGKFAVHTTRKRMIGVQRELKKKGKPYRAFEILNLGKYERQHYIGVNPNLREVEQQKQLAEKEAAFVELILRAYRAKKTDGFATFHGKKAGRLVAEGPVNLPVTRLFVEEVILECRQKHITRVDILGFEFEMGLFPNVLDEARAKGIDIAPKYIPAEVFDKRAVDKNQVVFHDVAFIEVKPHVHVGAGHDLPSVAMELTDFSVFYSQDSIANAEASLKDKASKIVVEKGQIVKVSKDAKGIVSREVLTKKWTDWIDYWAVDFNFESKREIVRVKNEESGEWEERWTGDYIFENEWQSFRTKKDRSLELTSVFRECPPGRRKLAVKVVDIFGNDTMTIVEVSVGGKK